MTSDPQDRSENPEALANQAQPEDVVIDLSSERPDRLPGPVTVESLQGSVTVEKWRLREGSAKIVAQSLVGIFGGSILAILAITFSVFVRSESPEQARAYAEVLTPVLKELASFMSSVFGPLLAFILGYYFSDKQKS
jgi:hypothetical protein